MKTSTNLQTAFQHMVDRGVEEMQISGALPDLLICQNKATGECFVASQSVDCENGMLGMTRLLKTNKTA